MVIDGSGHGRMVMVWIGIRSGGLDGCGSNTLDKVHLERAKGGAGRRGESKWLTRVEMLRRLEAGVSLESSRCQRRGCRSPARSSSVWCSAGSKGCRQPQACWGTPRRPRRRCRGAAVQFLHRRPDTSATAGASRGQRQVSPRMYNREGHGINNELNAMNR
jgi:hypothetical protein